MTSKILCRSYAVERELSLKQRQVHAQNQFNCVTPTMVQCQVALAVLRLLDRWTKGCPMAKLKVRTVNLVANSDEIGE